MSKKFIYYIMTTIIAKLKRPLRRFNIDNRAEAAISKEKPTPAPRPAAAIKQLKLAQQSNPEFLKEHYKKNVTLDEHLKSVFVTSMETKGDTLSKPNPDRPLPTSRTSRDFEFGFYIPEKVSRGKLNLADIFTVIHMHQQDPVKNSSANLAIEFQLKRESTEKLLEYYKLYQVITPEQSTKERGFLQLLIPNHE